MIGHACGRYVSVFMFIKIKYLSLNNHAMSKLQSKYCQHFLIAVDSQMFLKKKDILNNKLLDLYLD